ncbi:hypothetical protein MNAN1_001038 [Malassezia nana]|uniref:Efficient mitochondria targeting-associated protein 19 n=1 Tax=Malassezia nana TaxID=180528 RepID=A0AAF0J2U9_9BASI|nr:hypothetical protein MNAN1_001038 [Malassezia nana]
MTRAVPLWKRPVDAFYFAFFALHLCASLCVDNYLEQSADPLLPHAWEPRYAWMRMALFSEFVLQVPAFVLGLYALWKDDRRLYPVLVAYGAIACFTTIQCIAMVTIGEERQQLSSAQLQFILQCVGFHSHRNYVPFMLIPGLLCIDMVVRTARLLPAPRTAHIKST